jgi:DNA polymerase I-like protein with 3'-5' exonuclease and polymerase domains
MLALAMIDRWLFEAGIDGGPVAWLHDEIVLEVPVADADKAALLLRRAMTEAFLETLPGAPTRGPVEPTIGRTWAEAKSGVDHHWKTRGSS